MKTILRLFISALLLAGAGISQAGTFYPIAGITSSTQAGDLYPVSQLIQGPGTGYDINEPHDSLFPDSAPTYTWVTGAPGGYPSDFIAVAGKPVLVLDLGVDVPLEEVSVWGYSTNDNGVSMFSLKFATSAEGPGAFGTSITYNPTFEPTIDYIARQSFAFSQKVTARYVQFTCDDNFFKLPGTAGGDRVGLGEIAFEIIPVSASPNLVVSPATSLLINGLVQTFPITVLNNGSADLAVTGVTFTGTNAAAFSVVSLPPVISSLQTGTIEIQFTPGALSGDVSATMNIASNDPDTPSVPVALTGKFPSFYPIVSATNTNSVDFFPVANLIQGPGVGFMSTAPFTRLSSSTWVTDAPGGGSADYLAFAAPPVLYFDLNADVLLNEISVWGYGASNANGCKEFSLRFATAAEGPTAFGTSIAYNPVFTNLSNVETIRQSFTFSLPVTARYVELTCLDNFYGFGPPGGDRMGLGEVAFAIPAVSAAPDIDVPLSVVLPLNGTLQDIPVSVRNTGLPDLTISSVTFTGTNAAAFSTVTVPGALRTLQPADLVIRFNPAGLAGPISANMRITSNDPDESPLDVALTGLLHDPRLITASPVSLGTYPAPGIQTVNLAVQNTGATRPLTITGVTITGTNAANFQLLTIPPTIAVGASANIVLRFDPQGVAGPYSAQVDIASNDPAFPVKQVAISTRVRPVDILAAWWPLDDAPDAIEIADAGGSHPGAPVGVTLDQPGARAYTGKSALFDGFSSTINVPYAPELNPPGFTVVVWANSTIGASFNSVITSRTDAPPNLGGYILYDDADNNWAFWTGGGPGTTGWNAVYGGPVEADWTHLALVYDELTATKSLYVNGELANSASIPVAPNGSVAQLPQRNLHIGSGSDFGTQFYFSGSIDDVAVFSVPLTPEEIRSIRDQGVAGFTGAGGDGSFAITGIVRQPNGNIDITFSSAAGSTYTVQRSTLLGSWGDVTDNVPATGTSTTFTDTTLSPTVPRAFYRVKLNN